MKGGALRGKKRKKKRCRGKMRSRRKEEEEEGCVYRSMFMVAFMQSVCFAIMGRGVSVHAVCMFYNNELR